MPRQPCCLLLVLAVAWATRAIARRDAPGSTEAAVPVPVPISFSTTGVGAAQNRLKLNGAGIKIAIMDSGINWKHPAFGGCMKLGGGGTCRVLKGWDFVGETESGKYRPDSDPMDCKSQESSHGTQVASVAAGDASFFKTRPWRGVAYRAGIFAYKVSGSCKGHGSVSTNATLAAIRRASEDGADVFNRSYGDFRSGGYAERRYASALGAAMQRGALVAIASGNDGDFGPWFTEGGVAAPGVLSSAAVDVTIEMSGADLRVDPPLNVNSTKQSSIRAIPPLMLTSATMSAMPGLLAKYDGLKLPVKIVPAKPINGCLPLTNAAELRSGIALLIRGNCTFGTKAKAAAAAGAIAAIVYNNRTGEWLNMGFDEVPPIPVWGVQQPVGLAMLKVAASGAAAGMRLASAAWSGEEKPSILVEPALFSSWGPAATLEMNPSIAAPGSGVHTAAAGDTYTEVDGTSYSAPFVSGALALWRQARPEYWSGKQAPDTSKATSSAQATAGPAAATAAAVANKASAANTGAAKSWMASSRLRGVHEGSKSPSTLAHKPEQHGNGAATAAASAAASKRFAGKESASSSTASLPANMLLGPSIKEMEAAPPQPAAQQAAAYAAFVSTARPIDWPKAKGWAQPVARVGAGLIQVDAAVENPTRTEPTHLLLRSNQPSQTQNFSLTNAGVSYPIAYRLGHQPAAALSLKDTWFIDSPEKLLQQLAASVSYAVGGKPASEVVVQPGQTVYVQVTFKLPKQLQYGPYLYSGYVTATPTSMATPSSINTESAALLQQQQQQGGWAQKRLMDLTGFTGTLPFRPVPLVVPYQGFSQNYTTLPLLPQPNFKDYPEKSRQVLKSLLRVCFSEFAREFYDEAEADGPINQDGFLYQPHVDRCIYNAVDPSQQYKLPLKDIKEGWGVLIVAAALNRPAVRMQLMLFEANACKGGAASAQHQTDLAWTAPAGEEAPCLGGFKRGKQLGEVWRYTQPSRDYPLTLWSYYGYNFDGNLRIRDGASGKVLSKQPVQVKRQYKFQLWLVGPLAAADKAAGEQYNTWKYDVPGTYVFT